MQADSNLGTCYFAMVMFFMRCQRCGQCQRPDWAVSAMDSPLADAEPETEMVDQPFWVHGCGLTAGAVRRNLGGLGTYRRAYGGSASGGK